VALITAERVVPLLTEASPPFADRWTEWLALWEDDDEATGASGPESATPENPRGYYNDVAQFAHYLVKRFESGEIGDFPKVFDLVEILLSNGSEYVRDLIVIGLIEDLQTISSNRSIGRDALLPWCGPLASEAWDQVIEMWRGKGSLADVIRAEQRSGDQSPSEPVK
jgi:hypothetical protein